MKIYKPNFWDKKRIISSITVSNYFIVLLYIFFKKLLKEKYNIPIVCIGNIYLGGTGKPLSILIANQLRNKNKKSSNSKKILQKHSDEHILISKKF